MTPRQLSWTPPKENTDRRRVPRRRLRDLQDRRAHQLAGTPSSVGVGGTRPPTVGDLQREAPRRSPLASIGRTSTRRGGTCGVVVERSGAAEVVARIEKREGAFVELAREEQAPDEEMVPPDLLQRRSGFARSIALRSLLKTPIASAISS